MPSSDALAVLVERNDPERTLVALTMLSTLLTKARQDAAKYGSIKSGSKALASKVLQLEGGVVALERIGFRLQDDAYVFDASAEPEDVAAALAVFEAARTALLGLGDGNVPDAALAALKLVCIYAQNVVDAPDDASKRRVNAVNKALQSRVLSASGGRALLAAVGFEERAGGEAGGEAVFACDWADVRLLRVALGVLKRASDVWSAEAARSLGAPDAQAGAAEAKAAAPAEAVAGFNIRQLPPASRLGVPGAADMQPVLVLGEGARSVELHTWSAPSKRWQLQGRMPIPSTAFEWSGGLRIDVDLGDGTVKLLEAAVANDAIENEYHSAKRFIDDHPEHLDNNYLEEIARNIRTLAAPVLQTVQNLKAAMEAQN